MKSLSRWSAGIVVGMLCFAVAAAWAGPVKRSPAAKTTHEKAPQEKRAKSIEFEDGLVEGVNKQPGDYSTKTTKWKDRKEHLYKKAINFDHQLQETLRETRYAQ